MFFATVIIFILISFVFVLDIEIFKRTLLISERVITRDTLVMLDFNFVSRAYLFTYVLYLFILSSSN